MKPAIENILHGLKDIWKKMQMPKERLELFGGEILLFMVKEKFNSKFFKRHKNCQHLIVFIKLRLLCEASFIASKI